MKKLKRLLPWLKGSRIQIFFSLLFSLVATVCKLAIPFLAGLLINYFDYHAQNVCRPEDGCMDESAPIIIVLLFLLIICLVVGTIFRHIFDYTKAFIGQKSLPR